MKLDKTEVTKILVNEFHYTEKEAETFINNFPFINEELVPSVKQWLNDRTILDTDFGGITIEEVMKANNRHHFLLAILDLNRLFDKDFPEQQKSRFKELLKQPKFYYDK